MSTTPETASPAAAPAEKPRLALRSRHPWLGSIVVLLTLVYLGASAADWKFAFVADHRFIGHADMAGYASMGKSLAEGRWLQVPYVSWFFIPYSPGITRLEDHWPPFMGVAMAPFFKAWGVSTLAAKAPAIYIGSIGLPLATAALGFALSRRAYVGLLAGLLMLTNPAIFADSMCTLSDIAVAMWVAAFLAALLAARDRPWLHVVAGACAGLAYLSKGSQLLLFPLYPLLAVLACGPAVLKRRWMYLGLLSGGLLISPFLLATWHAYGNPLHCTQNYVSGYIRLNDTNGGFGWEKATYKPYWGRDLPKVSDRWTTDWPAQGGEDYRAYVRSNREQVTRWALLGPSASPETWARDFGETGRSVRAWLTGSDPPKPRRRPAPAPPEHWWQRVLAWQEPACAVPGLLTMGLVPVVLIGTMAMAPPLWAWRKWRQRRAAKRASTEMPAASAANATTAPSSVPSPAVLPSPATPPAEPWLFGPLLAVLLVAAINWAFLVFLLEGMPRLTLVLIPLVCCLGLAAASRVLEFPWNFLAPRFLARWSWVPAVLLAAATLYFFQQRGGWPDAEKQVKSHASWPQRDPLTYPVLGEWFAARYPGAVVMTRNPWELTWHAGGSIRGVAVPYAPAEQVFAVARYFKATHIVQDAGIPRPGLDDYFTGRKPGLRRVRPQPRTIAGEWMPRVFELDYSQLPDAPLPP